MVSYRAARSDDAATLTSIAIASKAHWGYPRDWMELWRPQLEIHPEQIEQHHFVVAESGGVVIGFAAIFLGVSDAELEHLWVLSQWMGRGVGRRLLDQCLRWCAMQGIAAVALVSDPGAEPFYERMGAIRIGMHPSVPEGRMLPVMRFENLQQRR